jgi:alkyl hydroperoxide reductase subunit AhpF
MKTRNLFTGLMANRLGGHVSENCDALSASNCVISLVTSDEPNDNQRLCNTVSSADIKIAADCKSVQLEAERNGNGRVYKITLKVKDAAGNLGQAVTRVSIPLRSSTPAIDSGIAFTVTGCSP